MELGQAAHSVKWARHITGFVAGRHVRHATRPRIAMSLLAANPAIRPCAPVAGRPAVTQATHAERGQKATVPVPD